MNRLLIPLLLLASSAQAAPPLQPMDIFELEFATDAQISPDGNRIAYVRHFNDVMTDKRHQNLWVINTDGTNHQPISAGKHNAQMPRWSPDGTRIAYLSNESGSQQIHVRWIQTGDSAAITNLSTPPSNIAWAPDGSSIAFSQLVAEAPLVIGEMPTAPAGANWAAPPKYTDKLIFRFNGIGDVPRGYMHLFVVAADGGTPRQITQGNRQFGDGTFAWAPEGESLLISANLTEGGEVFGFMDSDVYEVSIQDGSFKQLTDRDGPDAAVAVSPDGQRIAYVGYEDRIQGHQQNDLQIAQRDGSNVRNLTAEFDRQIQAGGGVGGGPQWSVDSKGIYAVVQDEGDSQLVLFDLEGGESVVAEDLGSGFSGYIGSNTLWSSDQSGTIALTVTTPDTPGDVAILESDGEVTRLTELNRDLFALRELGLVEELWWESSKDGRPVQGWIVKPPGFDPAQKYPLILEIHGGPFADYGDVFAMEKQLMAAGGYVVLYTNPRGSVSYGEEFGNLIHHAYPGDDFFDLDSAVDHVIGLGYIDESQLYVTGGSGGGVLTAWMIGNTDRFRAAVAFYPVINWESFIFTGDLTELFAHYWVPGMPWRHRENFESRSLLAVSENVKTPTLIMTGEEDWRTPMSESEQYYKALKLQGVETVLVRVPGEPHGIIQRPSHAISKMTTLLGWFARHSE